MNIVKQTEKVNRKMKNTNRVHAGYFMSYLTRDRLREYCQRTGRIMSAVVERAIEDHLDRHDKKTTTDSGQ